MNERFAKLSVAEVSAKVADEGTNPIALDGLGVAMQSIRLATSLGIPEMVPVRGLIAGVCKARSAYVDRIRATSMINPGPAACLPLFGAISSTIVCVSTI
jgi:hypothetical protein